MRFNADGHKINRKIIYPSQLSVPKYGHDGQHNNAKSIVIYNLCAVIVHEGNQISSSHYVCYTKRNGKWFFMSDTVAKESSLLVAHSLNAYMLFYEREVIREENPTVHTTIQDDIEHSTCTSVVKANCSGIASSHTDNYAEAVKKGSYSEVKTPPGITCSVAENEKSMPVQSYNTNKRCTTHFSTPSVSKPTQPNQSKLSLRRVSYPIKKQMAPSPKQRRLHSSSTDKSEKPLISTQHINRVSLPTSVSIHSTDGGKTAVSNESTEDSITPQMKSKELNKFSPSSTSTSPVNSSKSAETSSATSPDTATSSEDDVIITKIETPKKSEYDVISHITVKREVPPDYYVQPGYQNVKPGLHKTKQVGNALDPCPTVLLPLRIIRKRMR